MLLRYIPLRRKGHGQYLSVYFMPEYSPINNPLLPVIVLFLKVLKQGHF